MVTFDEVDDSSSSSPPPPLPPPTPPVAPLAEELASQSRLLDAEAIEEVAKKMTRISARMHLESLAKKLRKESEALKRVEKSKDDMSKENNASDNTVHQGAAATAVEEEAATATTTSPSLPPKTMKPPTAAVPVVAGIAPSAKFIPVDRFSFDAGDYGSQFVTVYVPLPGVGSISRELVTCEFTKSSFDLIVRNLKEGKSSSYRLFKDNLEHEIDDTKSKIIVKADKVIVKLAKMKKEYGGFDYWTKLIDNKKGHKTAGGGAGNAAKENPQDSIMKLMRDMYEEGDDNMKKMIGETMMKQQRGELNRPDMNKMGGGGIGGDNMNFDDEDF